MRVFAIRITKFVAAFLCCSVLCTILWSQFVTDKLYNCTDPGWLDYLFPGLWVHNPIVALHVNTSRSMNEQDIIREGWSITRLWWLWFTCIGASILAITLFALKPWVYAKQDGIIGEHPNSG